MFSDLGMILVDELDEERYETRAYGYYGSVHLQIAVVVAFEL